MSESNKSTLAALSAAVLTASVAMTGYAGMMSSGCGDASIVQSSAAAASLSPLSSVVSWLGVTVPHHDGFFVAAKTEETEDDEEDENENDEEIEDDEDEKPANAEHDKELVCDNVKECQKMIEKLDRKIKSYSRRLRRDDREKAKTLVEDLNKLAKTRDELIKDLDSRKKANLLQAQNNLAGNVTSAKDKHVADILEAQNKKVEAGNNALKEGFTDLNGRILHIKGNLDTITSITFNAAEPVPSSTEIINGVLARFKTAKDGMRKLESEVVNICDGMKKMNYVKEKLTKSLREYDNHYGTLVTAYKSGMTSIENFMVALLNKATIVAPAAGAPALVYGAAAPAAGGVAAPAPAPAAGGVAAPAPAPAPAPAVTFDEANNFLSVLDSLKTYLVITGSKPITGAPRVHNTAITALLEEAKRADIMTRLDAAKTAAAAPADTQKWDNIIKSFREKYWAIQIAL